MKPTRKFPDTIRTSLTKHLNGRYSWDAFVFFTPVKRHLHTYVHQFCDLLLSSNQTFATKRQAVADMGRVTKTIHLP